MSPDAPAVHFAPNKGSPVCHAFSEANSYLLLRLLQCLIGQQVISLAKVHRLVGATKCRDPSIPFVRALRDALSSDQGTVLRWATHENTVLSQLRARLLAEPCEDAADLIQFIESITCRQVPDGKVSGERHMVDLCKLAELHYFHPSTKGRCSLKKVLPSLFECSDLLREQYGRPVYGSASMSSLNHVEPIQWWQQDAEGITDPYDLLPALFEDSDACDDAERLQDGGSAMAAFARLQFESLPAETRKATEAALLRYCELDTLAMVMAVQAMQAWIHDRPTGS